MSEKTTCTKCEELEDRVQVLEQEFDRRVKELVEESIEQFRINEELEVSNWAR